MQGTESIKQDDFFAVKEAGVRNEQSPPLSVEVTNGWIYAAPTPYVYIALPLC